MAAPPRRCLRLLAGAAGALAPAASDSPPTNPNKTPWGWEPTPSNSPTVIPPPDLTLLIQTPSLRNLVYPRSQSPAGLRHIPFSFIYTKKEFLFKYNLRTPFQAPLLTATTLLSLLQHHPLPSTHNTARGHLGGGKEEGTEAVVFPRHCSRTYQWVLVPNRSWWNQVPFNAQNLDKKGAGRKKLTK